MARSSVTQTRSSETPRQQKIRQLLADGYEPVQIARALAPHSEKKRAALRRQIRRMTASDQEYIGMQLAESQGLVIQASPSIMEAVVNRARRGRVDAAKFALEYAGMYTPIQHRKTEHSGEVKLVMVAPRPPAIEEETIEDAEVVPSKAKQLGP